MMLAIFPVVGLVDSRGCAIVVVGSRQMAYFKITWVTCR
jgi:hypothetical protein